LADAFAEKKFREWLDTDQIFIKPSFSFPQQIIPGNTSKDITKSLYEKEGMTNGFEEGVINEIANLPNILFWTRNLERKGFCINGFINHYPDSSFKPNQEKRLCWKPRVIIWMPNKNQIRIDLGQQIRKSIQVFYGVREA